MWGRSLLDNELLDLKLIHLFCSFHKNIYWTLNSKSSHTCRMNYAWRIYLIFTIALRYRHYQPHFSVSSHCLSHNLKGPAWPEPPTFLPFLISLSVLLPATPCDPATRLPYSSSCASVPRLPQGFCISCAFGQENPLPYFHMTCSFALLFLHGTFPNQPTSFSIPTPSSFIFPPLFSLLDDLFITFSSLESKIDTVAGILSVLFNTIPPALTAVPGI